MRKLRVLIAEEKDLVAAWAHLEDLGHRVFNVKDDRENVPGEDRPGRLDPVSGGEVPEAWFEAGLVLRRASERLAELGAQTAWLI